MVESFSVSDCTRFVVGSVTSKWHDGPTRPTTFIDLHSFFERRATAGDTLSQPRLRRDQIFRRATTRGSHDARAHEARQAALISRDRAR